MRTPIRCAVGQYFALIVSEAVKECHYYFIAIADGDQPQVRPFCSFDIMCGNIVWGKNWDMFFPIEQLHQGVVE